MKTKNAKIQKNLVYTKPQLVKLANSESIQGNCGVNYDGLGTYRTDLT